MDQNKIDSWTAVLSEATPMTVDKLCKLIDFCDPPDLYEFICRQWEKRAESDTATWDLLMDGQIILRAVSHPKIIPVANAIVLTGFALQSDGLFDTKLLRRLLAHRLWPEEVPADEVMRTLEVLESLEEPHRLSMTLLKFSKFPNRRVQSKVAKILGRCVDSFDVMDELFQNPDARVRANLLEGISRRPSFEALMPIIERATKDQHTRVSSIALALRAQDGHARSSALMRMRENSKMTDISKSAEFARRIAAGEFPNSIRSETGGESLAAVVDGQPAVAAAVEEVNQ